MHVGEELGVAVVVALGGDDEDVARGGAAPPQPRRDVGVGGGDARARVDEQQGGRGVAQQLQARVRCELMCLDAGGMLCSH